MKIDRRDIVSRCEAWALVMVMAAGLLPSRLTAQAKGEQSVVVASPNADIQIAFELQDIGNQKATATYRVEFCGKPLVGQSRLGLEFAEGGTFGNGLRIAQLDHRVHDETYRSVIGKSSAARDRFREAVIRLEETAGAKRRIDLILRAYDDGVAFRYRIPEQPALATFTITDEPSQFVLPGDSLAWVKPLADYTTSYEAYYDVVPVSELRPEQLYGLPLLLKHPGGAWVGVTEANLTDYAGMFLSRGESFRRPNRPESIDGGTPLDRATKHQRPDDGQRSPLVCRLAPWPGQPKVKVRAKAPHSSPWRVIMIADDPARLIESNLIVNLNDPCRIEDTSWVKPGKVLFPWWNGCVVKGEDFEGGLNTATMKHYIDFCAESGIESFSLDGFRNQAWYGGPIQPGPNDKPQDITTSVGEVDLPAVLRHAKQKGVRLRIWMHWKPLRGQIDRAFAVYEEWGIAGVMVDFLDRNDQEMVRFYHEVLKKAAKHHLTVNFHGAYKPTGIRRTWPNLLTREGVLNLEYNKFEHGRGVTPEHELIVPFARMLAGPLDYHQGGFRHVVESQFKPHWIAPFVRGTRARALANYVVFENHLPMVADYPAAYRGQIGIEFVAAVPSTWDETRVLNAAVGDYITVARRHGRDWYVGSMTDGTARELTVPLRFLPNGDFTAEIYRDDPDAADSPWRVIRELKSVASADTITARLSPAGGHAIRLTPIPGQ